MNEREREALMKKSREHLNNIAAGLLRHLTPIDASGLLIGCAANVLEAAFGRQKTSEFFLELAAEYNDQQPEPSEQTN